MRHSQHVAHACRGDTERCFHPPLELAIRPNAFLHSCLSLALAASTLAALDSGVALAAAGRGATSTRKARPTSPGLGGTALLELLAAPLPPGHTPCQGAADTKVMQAASKRWYFHKIFPHALCLSVSVAKGW